MTAPFNINNFRSINSVINSISTQEKPTISGEKPTISRAKPMTTLTSQGTLYNNQTNATNYNGIRRTSAAAQEGANSISRCLYDSRHGPVNTHLQSTHHYQTPEFRQCSVIEDECGSGVDADVGNDLRDVGVSDGAERGGRRGEDKSLPIRKNIRDLRGRFESVDVADCFRPSEQPRRYSSAVQTSLLFATRPLIREASPEMDESSSEKDDSSISTIPLSDSCRIIARIMDSGESVNDVGRSTTSPIVDSPLKPKRTSLSYTTPVSTAIATPTTTPTTPTTTTAIEPTTAIREIHLDQSHSQENRFKEIIGYNSIDQHYVTTG